MAETLGKYELLSEVGSGAFAIVYRARDTILDRLVALKILKPAFMADPTSFARFVREAQVTANLFHPHIATVLDMGEANGRHFIAMRYVDGLSLDKVLAQRGSLPWAEALKITEEVASALDFAHARGLIHRDVKPQNIIISQSEGAMLTDFGIVKAIQSTTTNTATGAMLGTAPYIPPEVWSGKEVTPASDQYALACVMAEMLTAKVLFAGDSVPAIMTLHVMTGPTLPRPWSAGVPNSFNAFLQCALSKEPTQRFLSMQAFTVGLQRIAGIDTVTTAPKIISDISSNPIPSDSNVKSPLQRQLAGVKRKGGLLDSFKRKPREPISIDNAHRIRLVIKRKKESSHSQLVWSPDSTWLAVSMSDSIDLLYCKDLEKFGNFHTGGFTNDHAISPNGGYLVADMVSKVKVWDLHANKAVYTLPKNSTSRGIAFSPDSQLLALGDHSTAQDSIGTCITRWNTNTWQEERKLVIEPIKTNDNTHGLSQYSLLSKTSIFDFNLIISKLAQVSSVGFSPSGKYIAATLGQNGIGALIIWNIVTGQITKVIEMSYSDPYKWTTKFSPDGQYLAIASEAGIIVRDVSTLREVHSFSGGSPIAFSPNSEILASAPSGIDLWDVRVGRKIRSIDPYEKDPLHPVMPWNSSIAISPDGQYLALDEGDSLSLWSVV